MDFFPLIVLFAISITGLALTVSQEWLRGASYSFLAILHAITVIAGLLFLPFGKFFHIFQRPAQLGVKLYQEAGDAGEGDPVRPLRAAVCIADAHRRPAQESSAGARIRLSHARTTAGHWQAILPAMQTKIARQALKLRIKEKSHG